MKALRTIVAAGALVLLGAACTPADLPTFGGHPASPCDGIPDTALRSTCEGHRGDKPGGVFPAEAAAPLVRVGMTEAQVDSLFERPADTTGVHHVYGATVLIKTWVGNGPHTWVQVTFTNGLVNAPAWTYGADTTIIDPCAAVQANGQEQTCR